MASSDPVYLRVVEDIRRQIIDGTLPPGAPIPSRHQITRKYSVGETAARHALRVLVGEGLIIGRVGSGHRVREKPILLPLQRGRAPDPQSAFTMDMQACGRLPTLHWRSELAEAPQEIAQRLRLEDCGPVIRVSFVFRGDGRPMQLLTSYEVIEFGQSQAPEDGMGERRSMLSRLAAAGTPVTEISENVHVRVPQPTEIDLLELPAGVQVLHVERTTWTGDRPVETSDIVIPGDRFRLSYGIPVHA
ncbi:GntR family transcriptional regulator [Sphaerimonospora thailandensis]|uniref:GntR family transcriptional regulator n=1 Tax=Sphaerimonospora thailandensis TaxID=795644 RepID=A0A8J3R6H3_9ACTN|nr:GntR family transcriptional regulator [Sphaerimonospora thailandensis]GIH68721.1 GntR family transcriptional regulator [Sphaerimonospora thailandensis]